MSAELREEIARALYEHDPGWDPEPWEKTNARMRAAYRVSADAILPIIARVRDEARAEVIKWIEDDASICDCAARSSGECACGAWDDYKQVTSTNLVQQLREAFNKPTGETQ